MKFLRHDKVFKKVFFVLPFLLLLISSTKLMAGKPFSRTDDLISSTVMEEHFFVDASIKGIDINKLASQNSSIFNSFQLFSHGRPGELLIDGKWKDAQGIAVWLNAKPRSFNPSSINIYGCRFGEGAKGREAVAFLKQVLGIPVAASSNITGKNGDWILEVGLAMNTVSLPQYPGDLQCGSLFGKGPNQDYDCDGILNKDDLDKDNDGILNNDEAPIRTFRLFQPSTFGVNFATVTDGFNIANFDLSDSLGLPAGSVIVSILNGHIMEQPVGTRVNQFSAKLNIPTRFTFSASSTLNVAVQVRHGQNLPGDATKNTQDGMVSDDPMIYTNSTGTSAALDAGLSFIDYLASTTPPPGNSSITNGHVYAVKNSTSGDIENSSGAFVWTSATDSVRQIRLFTNANGTSNNYFELRLIYQYLDTDGDGISNEYDLDSDGDGCPDAIEGSGSLGITNISISQLPGGNSGVGYNGTYLNPVITNLGNATVQANGVVTNAGGGQGIGISQNKASVDPECGSLLAISTPSFAATPVQNKKVKISWQTISEVNSHYFIVERSTDAAHWSGIATINAAGRSSTTLSYSVIDPTPNSGINFYRLKESDIDGQRTVVSPVVSITITGVKQVVISPNLIRNNRITIRLNNEITNKPVTFQLFNLQGQMLQQWNRQNANGVEKVDISTKLPAATYLLRVTSETNSITERVVVDR